MRALGQKWCKKNTREKKLDPLEISPCRWHRAQRNALTCLSPTLNIYSYLNAIYLRLQNRVND